MCEVTQIRVKYSFPARYTSKLLADPGVSVLFHNPIRIQTRIANSRGAGLYDCQSGTQLNWGKLMVYSL